jgi:hypothetical protein
MWRGGEGWRGFDYCRGVEEGKITDTQLRNTKTPYLLPALTNLDWTFRRGKCPAENGFMSDIRKILENYTVAFQDGPTHIKYKTNLSRLHIISRI